MQTDPQHKKRLHSLRLVLGMKIRTKFCARLDMTGQQFCVAKNSKGDSYLVSLENQVLTFRQLQKRGFEDKEISEILKRFHESSLN
jgi:hypothetical protein